MKIMVKGESYSYKNRPLVMKRIPDSLTLGMLYSILKKAFPDIEVEIYDETVELVEKEKISADIVGISAITPAFYKAIEYSEYFRQKNIPVFIGGAHATLAPETCSENFDSVIVGLANETLVELINDFKNNSLKKMYTQNPQMSFENFVFPERELYERKHFLGTELDMVQATYGCSNVCKFCVQPYICNGYHQRPVQDVLEEINTIKSSYIEFVDPNFGKDLNYLKELCVGLKFLQKKWFAPMTLLIAKNEENLRMLKEAGCVGVLIGFETLEPDTIDTIDKNFNTAEQYEEVVKMFHKYDIEVTGSFVLGLDGDTKETADKILDFIIKAGVDYPRFTINTPFPGTKYYEEMKANGRLITEDYKLYDCCHCVIKPLKMTSQEDELMFERIWSKSYSIVNIIKRLNYIKPFPKKVKAILKNFVFGMFYKKMNIK